MLGSLSDTNVYAIGDGACKKCNTHFNALNNRLIILQRVGSRNLSTMENLQLANRIHHHDHVYHKTENTLVCQ